MTDPAPARAVRHTLVRNTAFNAAGRLWEAVCNIVLTAYILSHVSIDAWGLWGLVGIFTSYVALLDFGMSSGFAKYVAEHAARKETDEISAIVSTGFFSYLLLGALVVAVLWPGVDLLVWAVSLLSQDPKIDLHQSATAQDARFLLRWGLVLLTASNCAAAFTSIQTGLQRMGITNALGFAVSFVKIAATIIFLELGWGIRGLLGAQYAVFIVFAVAGFVIAHRLVPGLRVSWRRVSWAAARKLYSFGWRAQVSRLSNIIMFQTDRLIVGAAYRQLGLVGVYSLAEELSGKMRQAPGLLLSAIMPAASDLDARGESERLTRLYLLSTKYVAAVTVPMVAFFVGAAGLLMHTWLGNKENLDIAAWVQRILAFGYIANIVPGAGVSIALGMGRPDIQMKAGIIATVSNIASSILFVLVIGFYGVPLGTALSMFLSCAWFMHAMRPVVGIGARQLLRATMLWPVVAALPGFAVCVATDFAMRGIGARIPNAAGLMACAAVLSITYVAVLRAAPFFTEFDSRFIAQLPVLRSIPGIGRLFPARLAEEA